MAPYEAIIIDTETTDTTPDLQVAELAWQKFDFSELFVPERGRMTFKLSKPMSWGALATHHILPEDLADATMPAERAPTVVPPAYYWIGHKVDFDWRALGTPPVRRICTLAMARDLWPKCDVHTISALMYFLEGATPQTRALVKEAHGAQADVGLCSRILGHILREKPEIKTIEDLWAFSERARVPTVMSFGKYKGQPISAVDKGWANWYKRQDETDEYLLVALQRAGKL